MESSDSSILVAVEAYLGCDTLHCKHCHSKKPLSAFIGSLKKLWVDGALKKVPRTCDKMQSVNASQNAANNKINNTRTSIRRYEAKKAAAAREGKDVHEFDMKLAELHVKLEAAIAAKAAGAGSSDDDEEVFNNSVFATDLGVPFTGLPGLDPCAE